MAVWVTRSMTLSFSMLFLEEPNQTKSVRDNAGETGISRSYADPTPVFPCLDEGGRRLRLDPVELRTWRNFFLTTISAPCTKQVWNGPALSKMAQELVTTQVTGRWVGRTPPLGRTAELRLWDKDQSLARLVSCRPRCTSSHGPLTSTTSRVSAPFHTHNMD